MGAGCRRSAAFCDKPASLSGQRSWQVQGLPLALTLGTLVWQIKNRQSTQGCAPFLLSPQVTFCFDSSPSAPTLFSEVPLAPRGFQTVSS